MSQNININLDDLESFIGVLQQFNRDLETNWSRLKARWVETSDSWRDVKKDQFTNAVGWDEVIRTMEAYQATSDSHVDFLKRLYERGDAYRNS